MLLSDLEEDALKEMFNIGIGRAAAALSMMVNTEIVLSVPEVHHLHRKDAAALIGNKTTRQVSAIRQAFYGPFSGTAMLVYPEEQSLALVRALLRDDTPLALLSAMEQESLLEVGNVILNACLGSLANLIGVEILCELPEYFQGLLPTLLPPQDDNARNLPDGEDDILVLNVDFSVSGKKPITGYMLLLLNLNAGDNLKQELVKIMGGQTA